MELIHPVIRMICRLASDNFPSAAIVLVFAAAGFVYPGIGQTAALAQDGPLSFVEGLRARGYFDTALEYLDELADRPGLSENVRDVLELERGLTLKQMGTAARVSEDRDRHLTAAEDAFRRFLEQHPQHAQAASASARLGELLIERARTMIWKADGAPNETRRGEIQQQARRLIDDAEAIFQKAHDLYAAEYKKFPTYIDQTRDPDAFQQRLDAEDRYMRAWFSLSRCTYERGQTWDRGSEERRELLIRAAELFSAIHASRRTNLIGLHARLMMGKCFQEQDDLGRALGIYNEMRDYPSDQPGMPSLKSTALHYRLICLNHPQRQEYQLVLQDAGKWLQSNRSLLSSDAGLGILWEKAFAEEKLAEDRSLDPKAREVMLRQALADAQQVARDAGPFREPANSMVRRVKAALGDRDQEPRNFETAFERARSMIDQIQKLKDGAEQAGSDAERQQKQLELDLHLNEVGRLLQVALELRSDDTDGKAAAQARYLLSFIFFRQRKNFDAIIMARHCMVSDRAADPETALNATDIAITAAVQAWNDAPESDRDFETGLLRDVCMQVLELYPQSARGNEARMRLGRVYQQQGKPLEAGRWFLQVPESDAGYALARISAGQAFWTAWTMQAADEQDLQEAERRSAQDMQNLKNEARTLLLQGTQLYRDRAGAGAGLSDEVLAAEISLASIRNLDGDFQQSVDRLTSGEDNSVISILESLDAQSRPESGVMSRTFAGLAFRILLRAYVGTQQFEEAIQTMARLEKIGGQDLASVYTQLGMELQQELQRLKQSGEIQRLADVRKSFEEFLQLVFNRRDPSDYNSLLWIGETYFGLGQGVGDDAAAAAGYYDNAATAYRTILDGNLTQEPTTTAIQLRLARCRRQQRQYQEAFQITHNILSANPLALDAQFEAALTLADWGVSGQPEKLQEAIQGVRNENSELIVWGWSNIAKRLQQTVQNDSSAEMKQRLLDARYQLAASRRRYAALESAGAADGETQLRSALAEITIFVQVYRDIDEGSWGRLDRLYQDIQTDLGQSPRALERPLAVAVAEPPEKPFIAQTQPQQPSAGEADTVVADSEGGWLPAVLAICLAAGLGAGFYFLLSRPPQRRRPLYAEVGEAGFPSDNRAAAAAAGRAASGIAAEPDLAAIVTQGAATVPRRPGSRTATTADKSARRPSTSAGSGRKDENRQSRPQATPQNPAAQSTANRPKARRPKPPETSGPEDSK